VYVVFVVYSDVCVVDGCVVVYGVAVLVYGVGEVVVWKCDNIWWVFEER
jgi:hypothetical protein